MAILATAHIIVDQLKDAVTVRDSKWAIFSAKAAALAAFFAAAAAVATAVLAYVTNGLVRKTGDLSSETRAMADETKALAEQTAQQVSKSNEAIEQGRRQHQVDNTIRLMNDYMQTQIYASEDVFLTAHVASAKINNYAKKIPDLKALIKAAAQDDPSVTVKKNLRRINPVTEFDSLCNSVAIFDNYFMSAYQQLARRLLDEALFKNTFAASYIETRKGLEAIGDLLTVKLGNAEIHARLRAFFEEHLTASADGVEHS